MFMISQLMIQQESIGKGDDYTTGCLLDFAYFEKNYKIIAADLSKQKALDADSRAIQQIIFTGHTDAQIRVYYNTKLKSIIRYTTKKTKRCSKE